MTAIEYYRHVRSLDARIPASDSWRMAKEGAILDENAAIRRIKEQGASLASYEVMPDGTGLIQLSFQIKVF